MTVSPLGIPFTLSIALGLGAFALVELNGFRTDLAAMALLVLAGLSHTFGTIVAVGVLVYLLVERSRRREVWIALVPLALWVAWWVWARQFDQGITESSNILGAPFFVLKAAGAALQGAVGVPTGSTWIGDFGSSLVRALFDLLALAGIVLLAFRLRRGPTGPWAWGYLATIVAFWVGIALSAGDGREPATPRYLFFGAIMIFLIVAELMRGRAVPVRFVRPLLALFALSLVCNSGLLFNSISSFNADAAAVRAELAAVGFDADYLAPDVRLGDLDLPGDVQVPSSPAAIASFEADVGSTGFTLDELRAQPEDVRARHRPGDHPGVEGCRRAAAPPRRLRRLPDLLARRRRIRDLPARRRRERHPPPRRHRGVRGEPFTRALRRRRVRPGRRAGRGPSRSVDRSRRRSAPTLDRQGGREDRRLRGRRHVPSWGLSRGSPRRLMHAAGRLSRIPLR